MNHVCIWDKDGWKRITAEEATASHPGGTVSATSEIFMCELCHQFVTLTDGDIRIRYFKHSKAEDDKNCADRAKATSGYSQWHRPNEHELPIRIVGISASSFRFEIGLIRVPTELLSKSLSIEIKPTDNKYEWHRIKTNEITYLSVGDHPYEKYTLNITGNQRLYNYWSKEINGISPDGTLFEEASGKKLANDADVEICKKYYLLIRGYLPYHEDIESLRISTRRIGYDTWNLYTVSAPDFSENSARFFLKYHCRLTAHPISIQPIYPLFVEGDYAIKHSESKMYVIADGDDPHLNTFPGANPIRLSHKKMSPVLYKVPCPAKQQLISAGRERWSRPLLYTYFWEEPLAQEGKNPKITVTDLSGTQIGSGEVDLLPKNKTLRFKSNYDGELIVAKDDYIIDKRRVPADKYIELDNLSYGMGVRFVVGLDCVWRIRFRKPLKSFNDAEVLRYITSVSGRMIPAPHSLRNIMLGMKQYPEICRWIRKCIKSGTISEQSYRRLQQVYLNRKGEAQ